MSSCQFDYEPLVAALHERGVHFLAPSDARPGSEPVGDLALIACLASHDQQRLRTALAALFILHPELAGQLDALQLPPAAQTELRTQYTAAACLQRMWSIRLGFYLGEVSLLPDRYSAGLGLPPVNAHYGKLCLHTLAARQPFDQLSAYDSLMSLLFAQLKAETPHEHATAG
ncbi:MAG: hypothetical protein M9927_11020 [Anaerolineae bacterium]|nr:hypothetical protein [Anaerolineae bacterium]